MANPNPKSNYKVITLLILLSSLYYFPSGSLCQTAASATKCGHPFQCANIPNITYPFWNADDSTHSNQLIMCGHPNFSLHCGAAAPILHIFDLPYRVLEIDFPNYTLRVARQDLWNNPCGGVPVDTILDPKLFQMPSDFYNKNLRLFYNCSRFRRKPPNQFTCGPSETTTTNFFRIGNGNPSDHFTCKQQITVPVNESAELALTANSSSLTAVLAGGFPIRWVVDNAACADCLRLGYKCAYNGNVSKFSCDTSPDIRANPRDPSYPFYRGAAQPAAPKSKNFTSPNSDQLNHRPSNRARMKLELGLSFGALVFAIAFSFILWWCKTRNIPGGPKNPNIEKFLLEQGSLALKRYKYSEIKKIAQSFNDKLGQGGYGSVYKGILPNGNPVAIKVLIDMDSNDEEFINEVASISRTSHVNIVSLLGFCYEKNKRALVYEFMPNNSLDKFIRDTPTSLDMETLYKIAIGVGTGLEYLHRGCNTRIIHFDIKPQNILLDEGFNPKISDFGLAKLCKKKTSILSVIGTRGTVGYIAPEVFSRNFGGVSHKSDVYSYGIMILEMAGARKVLESGTGRSSENYFPDKIYEQALLLDHGSNSTVDGNEYSMVELEDVRARKMLLLGFWCIQTMPSDRPSMSKVVEMLEGNIESIQIPPKPFLFDHKQLGLQEGSPSMSIQFE